MERRKHPRFTTGLPLSFSGHSLTGSGRAVDLSMGGCQVESDKVPQHSDFLEVTLSHPDTNSPLKIDSAVVRWVRGQSFGLEFVYMSDDATSGLDRLIQRVRKPPVKKEADRPPVKTAPLRAKSKSNGARKRPALVWAITIFYVLLAATTLTAFAHWHTAVVPLTAAQEALLGRVASGDGGWALAAAAVGLIATSRLFQLRAVAANLFLILIGISLFNGVWYAYTSNGLAYLFSMPDGVIARLIGIAVVFATWLYALRLKRTRRLT